MFSPLLLQTLKNLLEAFDPSDNDEGTEGLQKITQELGWKFVVFDRHFASGSGMVVSPCKKFILKHHYFGCKGTTATPPDAIPSHTVKMDGCGYAFTLQPRATINEDGQRRAYKALMNRGTNFLFDIKWQNCGYFRRRPVMIDW